jgi:hypothetical protein
MLALALAGGQSITEVAEQFGLCRKTVQNRLADPAFRQLVTEFRGQHITTALGYPAEGLAVSTRSARRSGRRVVGRGHPAVLLV